MSNCHGDEMTARPRPSISAMRRCDKGRLREICRSRLPCHEIPVFAPEFFPATAWRPRGSPSASRSHEETKIKKGKPFAPAQPCLTQDER